MQLDQALTRVAVLGAAGKMGSGIALLLLQEMARLEAEKGMPGSFVLDLIDTNENAFPQLRHYLREQLLKYAEKNINILRSYYAQNENLVSNEEIIDAFVNSAFENINFETDLSGTKQAYLIFEAIVEDIELKTKIFRSIVELGNKTGFFLTNTSSIPIQILNDKADLENRIIGFHFYNPPAVQKLLEIISTPTTDQNLKHIAAELAKRLNKTAVYSKDVAGFIGNGHMIREIAFACRKVEELSKEYTLPEAIYIVNKVTQDWLIRPMGIFQLADYVGLDVCQHICEIMRTNLKDPSLKMGLIEEMIKRKIWGGQFPDGSQKNGIFMYTKHILMGIYSIPGEKYTPFTDAYWIISADKALGELPQGHISWKAIQKDPNKEKTLKTYFEHLCTQDTLGCKLAQSFLQNSRDIAAKLINEGIANSQSDVDTVLTNGFFHVYGTKMGLLEAKA